MKYLTTEQLMSYKTYRHAASREEDGDPNILKSIRLRWLGLTNSMCRG